MGILEFHFHDPQFDFAPSMSTGGGDSSSGEEADDSTSLADWRTDAESDDESGGGPGRGALVALVVLVALAGLAGMKRRRGGEEAAEGEDATAELEA